MCSKKFSRFAGSLVLVIGLFAGIAVSAQDVTQEPTEDMVEMGPIHSNCPQGMAQATLKSLTRDSSDSGMTATEEAGMATEMPMMEATEDMGMTGAEGATSAACLFGTFSGAAEVPGPGDDDGVGVAFVSVDPVSGEVCYEVAVANITLPADAMHIHVNSAGLSGDVVVPFPTAPDAEGEASGCTNANVEGLAATIVTAPDQYYVNVHTSDFPAGAVRAQLSNWDPSTMNPGQIKSGG